MCLRGSPHNFRKEISCTRALRACVHACVKPTHALCPTHFSLLLCLSPVTNTWSHMHASIRSPSSTPDWYSKFASSYHATRSSHRHIHRHRCLLRSRPIGHHRCSDHIPLCLTTRCYLLHLLSFFLSETHIYTQTHKHTHLISFAKRLSETSDAARALLFAI